MAQAESIFLPALRTAARRAAEAPALASRTTDWVGCTAPSRFEEARSPQELALGKEPDCAPSRYEHSPAGARYNQRADALYDGGMAEAGSRLALGAPPTHLIPRRGGSRPRRGWSAPPHLLPPPSLPRRPGARRCQSRRSNCSSRCAPTSSPSPPTSLRRATAVRPALSRPAHVRPGLGCLQRPDGDASAARALLEQTLRDDRPSEAYEAIAAWSAAAACPGRP